MTTLNVKDKRNKTEYNFTFKNMDSVKNFIKNISTRDLHIKRYRFENNDMLEYMFLNTYTKDFFNHTKDYIELKILPNGKHRELKTNRKSFNNRTLKRVLQKIQEELELVSEDKYWYFDDNRYHLIEFLKPTTNPHIYSSVLVMFDKLKWEYEFIKLVLIDERLPAELRRLFNAYTTPLKQYKRMNNNENNIK
jgi:hypothetical protein